LVTGNWQLFIPLLIVSALLGGVAYYLRVMVRIELETAEKAKLETPEKKRNQKM